jgi:hypothetical protein
MGRIVNVDVNVNTRIVFLLHLRIIYSYHLLFPSMEGPRSHTEYKCARVESTDLSWEGYRYRNYQEWPNPHDTQTHTHTPHTILYCTVHDHLFLSEVLSLICESDTLAPAHNLLVYGYGCMDILVPHWFIGPALNSDYRAIRVWFYLASSALESEYTSTM